MVDLNRIFARELQQQYFNGQKTVTPHIEIRLASHDSKVQAIGSMIATEDYNGLVNMLTITKHSDTDKMSGKYSLSSLVSLNPHCQKRIAGNAENTVCPHCFAESISGMRPDLKRSLARNTVILNNIVIPVESWRHCKAFLDLVKKGVKTFRLQAFGDVASVEQCTNYINLCKAFPEITFTVWSKNIWLYALAFSENGKPTNLIYIHSSLLLNQPGTIPARFAWFVDYRFTVYTREYHESHGIVANCCNGREKRFCKDCGHCYGSRHNDFDIIETLR